MTATTPRHPLDAIRPLDWVLTAVLAAVAVLVALANVSAGPDADVAHPLDSHSAAMVPVFVLAVVPILLRRRNVLAAVAASFVVIAASVPAFGWVTRCGFALPLAFAYSYAVARFAGSRQNQVIGLIGVVALQVATLVQDASTDGLGALALSLPLTAVAFGVGLFTQSRSARVTAGPTLSPSSAETVHA